MIKNIFKYVLATCLLLFSYTNAQDFLNKQNPIEKIGSFYIESIVDITSSLGDDFGNVFTFYVPLFHNTFYVYKISAINFYDSVKLSINHISDLGEQYIKGFNSSQKSAIFAGVTSVNILTDIGDGVLVGVRESLRSARSAVALAFYSTNKIGEIVLSGLNKTSDSTLYAKKQIENIFASIDSKGTDIGKNFALAIKSKNNINDQNIYVSKNKKKLQRMELTSSTSSFWQGLIDKISNPLVPLFVEKTKFTKPIVTKENNIYAEEKKQPEIIKKERGATSLGNVVNNYYATNYLPSSDLSKLRFEYLSLYNNLLDSINTKQVGQTEAIYRSVSHTVENISNSNITEGNITNSNISGGDASLDSLTVDSNTLVVDAENNRVGIATSSPFATLSVAGDFSLTGGFYDSSSSKGVDGYILQSTGTGTEWVATSSLGITGGGGGASAIEDLTDVSSMTESYGDLLYWNGTSWGNIATSSLGLLVPSDLTNYLSLSSWYATTTDGLAEGSTNRYYSDTLVGNYISSSSTIPHIGGTSYGDLLYWTGSAWNTLATSSLGIATSQWTTSGSDIYYNTGKVGVGSSTPNWKLSVAGIGSFDDYVRASYFSATSSTATSTFAGGLSVAGSSGLTVLQSGNVGIGTISPIYPLDVRGSGLFGITKKFLITSDYAGSGDLVSGALVSGIGSNGSISFAPSTDAGSVSGKIVFGYYNGSSWKSALEYSNSSGGSNTSLILQKNGGNVGIGTNGPSVNLHIYGTNSGDVMSRIQNTNASGRAVYQTYNNVGDVWEFSSMGSSYAGTLFGVSRARKAELITNTDGVIGTTNSNFLLFGTNSTEVMRITAGGNVGIGTTTPGQKLSVAGDILGNNFIGSYFTATSTTATTTLAGGLSVAGSNGLIVSQSGNVGVGTLDQNYKFTVGGDIYVVSGGVFAENSVSATYFTATSAVASSTFANGLNLTSGCFAVNGTCLSTGGSSVPGGLDTEIQFNQGGSLAGNSSFTWDDGNKRISAPLIYLDANTGGTPSVGLNVSGMDGYSAVYIKSGGSSGAMLELADSSDVTKFIVDPTGNVGVGTTSPYAKLSVVGQIVGEYFTATSSTLGFQATNLLGGATNLTVDANGNIIRDPSDRNLKENIETIDGALEKVLKLRGVSYEWKDKERFGNQTEIGVIAQEVEDVVPEVVSSGGEYKSVNIKNLVGLLIEAIKELVAKVESIMTWFKGDKLNIKNDVCVDDVCITKDQFKSILLQAEGNTNTNTSSNNSGSSSNSSSNTNTDKSVENNNESSDVVEQADQESDTGSTENTDEVSDSSNDSTTEEETTEETVIDTNETEPQSGDEGGGNVGEVVSSENSAPTITESTPVDNSGSEQ